MIAAGDHNRKPEPATEVLDRTRHKHLARAGGLTRARSDVNGNAADIIADYFALAGMKPGADFNAQRPELIGDGASAAHAACRTVESGENAVAGRLDFMAARSVRRVRRIAV